MSYEHILYEVDDKILTITLNRPAKMNAFTNTMLWELIDAFDKADEDDEVRAIIVTGAGERAFCAGADLSGGKDTFKRDQTEQDITKDRDGGGLVTLRIFDCKKPVIAAINGAAVGVGVTMTLPMDIRLASDNARFGLVFARRGIVPEAASSWFLPRVVGISQALEWSFSGRVFDAQEALRGGLVRSLHKPDELLPAAREIAREIADFCSPLSVSMTRQMLWKMLSADHPMDAHQLDSATIRDINKKGDSEEGVLSFLEKRPPKFKTKPSSQMPAFYPFWEERQWKKLEPKK